MGSQCFNVNAQEETEKWSLSVILRSICKYAREKEGTYPWPYIFLIAIPASKARCLAWGIIQLGDESSLCILTSQTSPISSTQLKSGKEEQVT